MGGETKKMEIMEICWNPFRSHFLNLDVSAPTLLSIYFSILKKDKTQMVIDCKQTNQGWEVKKRALFVVFYY